MARRPRGMISSRGRQVIPPAGLLRMVLREACQNRLKTAGNRRFSLRNGLNPGNERPG